MEFSYRARTKEGKLQSGTVHASSHQAALEVLRRHQLTVVFLEEAGGGSIFSYQFSSHHVSTRDLVAFSRSFASLIDAGVPLIEALRILADQTNNSYFRSVTLQVVDDIDGGVKLSQALAKYPKVFPAFYRNMIKSGETVGALQRTLLYLADYTEREYQLKSAIKSALMYPIFIISVFIIVFFIMMVFVFPRLSTILTQIGGGKEKLPFVTRFIMGVSDFTSHWFLVILLIMAGLGGWAIYWLRQENGKKAWNTYQLHLPVFGQLFRTIYQARFADNLSTLIRGGVPIVEAMHITADIVGNSVYENLINKIAEELKAGNTIESVIRGREELSPLLVQMIVVGERSGKLEEILAKVALFFEAEVDRTIKGLTPLLEPILIVILGVGVGVLVASVILPIYSLIGSGLGAS